MPFRYLHHWLVPAHGTKLLGYGGTGQCAPGNSAIHTRQIALDSICHLPLQGLGEGVGIRPSDGDAILCGEVIDTYPSLK